MRVRDSDVYIRASDTFQPVTEPRATYLVKRLESAVRRNLDLELGARGMTTPQYAALSILRAQPGLSSAQLARRAFVTPQSMQVMVTAFVRDGLVERRADPNNQRVLRNHLTRDGELLLLQADEAAAGIEQQMLGGLDREQTSLLRELMTVCIENLTASKQSRVR
jgi:DNA-binding MarR family transcriptional regulator